MPNGGVEAMAVVGRGRDFIIEEIGPGRYRWTGQAGLSYKDADGQWQPADRTLHAEEAASPLVKPLGMKSLGMKTLGGDIEASSPTPARAYCCQATEFPVYLGAFAGDGQRIETRDGAALTYTAQGISASAGQVDGNTITYPDAWPNADLLFRVLPEGISKEIILRQRPAQSTWTFAVAAEGLELVEEDGGLAWRRDGKVVWRTHRPWAQDANEDFISGQLTVRREGTTVLLDVTIDADWLAGAAYPVTVDPTTTLGPTSRDTQMRQAQPTSTAGGTATYLRAIKGYRPLFLFDGLPTNVNITSATLSLYMYNSTDSTGTKTMTVYKCTRTDWTESGCCWNDYKAGSPWTTPGGDYELTTPAPAVLTMDVEAYSNYTNTWDVTAIVADAVANGIPANFLMDITGIGTLYIYTRESNRPASEKPQLIVEYTVPMTVSTGGASAIGPTAATLAGTLVSGDTAACSFEYGTTTSYGSATSSVSRSAGQGFSIQVAGLTPNTLYHYRAVATDGVDTVYGDDAVFTTGALLEGTGQASGQGGANGSSGRVRRPGLTVSTAHGVGTSAGGGRRSRRAASTISAQGTASGSMGRIRFGIGQVTGTGATQGKAIWVKATEAVVSGAGAIHAIVTRRRPGGAGAIGTASSGGLAYRTQQAAGHAQGTGVALAAAATVRQGVRTLAGAGFITAAGRRYRRVTGSTTGTGNVEGWGVKAHKAIGSATGQGITTGAGTRARVGAGVIAGQGVTVGSSTRRLLGMAETVGSGATTADGTRAKGSAVGATTGTGSATGSANLTRFAGGTSVGQSRMLAQAGRVVDSAGIVAGFGDSGGTGSRARVGTGQASGAGLATGDSAVVGAGNSGTVSGTGRATGASTRRRSDTGRVTGVGVAEGTGSCLRLGCGEVVGTGTALGSAGGMRLAIGATGGQGSISGVWVRSRTTAGIAGGLAQAVGTANRLGGASGAAEGNSTASGTGRRQRGASAGIAGSGRLLATAGANRRAVGTVTVGGAATGAATRLRLASGWVSGDGFSVGTATVVEHKSLPPVISVRTVHATMLSVTGHSTGLSATGHSTLLEVRP